MDNALRRPTESESLTAVLETRLHSRLLPLALGLTLAFASAGNASAASVLAPPTATVGQQVSIFGSGFTPGSVVSVALNPARTRGGNCCGIVVVQEHAVQLDGTAQMSFSWPPGYYSCAGRTRCSTVAWQRDEAVDLTVTDGAPDTFATTRASVIVDLPGVGEDLTLAQRFRPVLAFDTSERWRPLNVARMFADDEPNLCGRLGCFANASTTALDGATGLDLPGHQDDADSYRSARPECRQNGLGDCESGVTSGIYTHTVEYEGYRYLDYWWYFRFNHAPFSKLYYDEHESDWEGMTIAVARNDPDPQAFDFAAIAAHKGVWRYLREALLCEDVASRQETMCAGPTQRVKVFVADGTHASYPRSCRKILFFYCRQTGVPLPEKGFDGRRPWGANYDPSVLYDLNRPWTQWPGNWNSQENPRVASPGRQNRFTSPWDATCTGRFAGSTAEDCMLGAASRAQEDSDCDSWVGPFVAATTCDPVALREALRDGALGQIGSVGLQLDGMRQASAPGLAQAVGGPLSSGQVLTVSGATPQTQLRVRAGAGDNAIVATYEHLPIAGRVTVQAGTRDGRLTLAARGSDGRALRATRLQRATARRPAAPTGVRAQRQRSRVHVSFRVRTPRLAVEVHGRGGRLLSSRLVRVRSSSRSQSLSVAARAQARTVVLAAVSAEGIPSRRVTVRIR